MIELLDRVDVLTAGTAAVGHPLEVGDYGLLDAAGALPRTTVFGMDAYPDLHTKAAALLQSLARNHAPIDGNKRTAWASAWAFLHINGVELCPDFDVDAAEVLMNDVAQRGGLPLDDIAGTLTTFAVRRHQAGRVLLRSTSRLTHSPGIGLLCQKSRRSQQQAGASRRAQLRAGFGPA